MPVRFKDEVEQFHHRHHSAEPSRRWPSSQKQIMAATHETIGWNGATPEPALQHKKICKSQSPARADVEREPVLQRKRRLEIEQRGRVSEPPLQSKKRSQSASPARDDSRHCEPPFQHRKKLSSVRQSSDVFFTDSSTRNTRDDYMLLGDQSKFAPNVVYKVKSKTALQEELLRKEAESQGNAASRLSVPLARRRVVDKPEKRHTKKNDGSHMRYVMNHNKSTTADCEPPCPTPLAPRGQTKAPPLEQVRPAPRVVIDTGRPATSQPSKESAAHTVHSENVKSNSGNAVRLERSRPKAGGDVASQTPAAFTRDTSSAPVEPVNKLRSRDVASDQARQSAKQGSDVRKSQRDDRRQTAVEQNINNSALNTKSNRQQTAVVDSVNTVATESGDTNQMADYAVKHRLGLVPHRSAAGPRRASEYQRQFQWRSFERNSPLLAAQQMVYKSHPELTSVGISSMSDTEYRSNYRPWSGELADAVEPRVVVKHNVRRTKSLRDLNDADQENICGNGDEGPSNSLQKSHHSHNRHSSTDATQLSVAANLGNYYPSRKMNSEYASQFKPPWKLLGQHLKLTPQTEHQQAPADDSSANVADWYAEVLELRRHADEYRRRALGTHFSRDHLAQLYARNAQLWDTVSNSSELSARSQPHSEVSQVKSTSDQEVGHNEVQEMSDDGTDYDDTASESPAYQQQTSAVRQQLNHHHHQAQTEPVTQNKAQRIMGDGGKRHQHLAQTMPVTKKTQQVIGAACNGVTQKTLQEHSHKKTSHHQTTDKQSASCEHHDVRNASIQADLSDEDFIRPKLASQKLMTHGLPTRDTHVLVDATNRTTYGNKDAVINNRDDDDDDDAQMSTARSIASSCSLASEVLARARSRRDEFWK